MAVWHGIEPKKKKMNRRIIQVPYRLKIGTIQKFKMFSTFAWCYYKYKNILHQLNVYLKCVKYKNLMA